MMVAQDQSLCNTRTVSLLRLSVVNQGNHSLKLERGHIYPLSTRLASGDLVWWKWNPSLAQHGVPCKNGELPPRLRTSFVLRFLDSRQAFVEQHLIMVYNVSNEANNVNQLVVYCLRLVLC